MKPYFEDAAVTLYLGDAAEVMASLPPASVACVVTSPPYNVGMEYGVSDTIPQEQYRTLADRSCFGIDRLLIPSGRIWLNVCPIVGEGTEASGPYSGATRRERVNLLGIWLDSLALARLPIRDMIAWVMPGRGGDCAWGSWQSPSAPNLRGDWEIIVVGYKGQWPRIAVPDSEWRDGIGGWAEITRNQWTFRPAQRNGHPAPFPLELPSRCIRLSTWPGETVLDPFIGAGTTALAAKMLGRKCIGIDAWEGALELAADRLRQEVMTFEAPPAVVWEQPALEPQP